MARYLPLLIIPLLLLATGCERVVEPDSEPAVVSFEVDFILDDLDFVGTVAAASYDTPELTRAVVNNGAVLAYFRDLEGTWTAMPFTYGVESEQQPAVDYTVTTAYAYERGRFDVFVESSTDDPVVIDAIRDARLFRGVLPVKVVVVRDFEYLQRSSVNFSDYNAVREHFGLEE